VGVENSVFTYIDFLEVELDLQVGVAPGVIVVVVIVGRLLVQRGCHSPAVVVHFFYKGCLRVVAAQMLSESAAPMVLRTKVKKRSGICISEEGRIIINEKNRLCEYFDIYGL
jgi:hypothetical protein